MTPLLADPATLRQTVGELAAWVKGATPTSCSAPRHAASGSARRSPSRPAPGSSRPAGRASCRRRPSSASYVLEYGENSLELHPDLIPAGSRVVIHDDVLATGGTVEAIRKLVEQLGGVVIGACFIIELTFLGGRERLAGTDLHALIEYWIARDSRCMG